MKTSLRLSIGTPFLVLAVTASLLLAGEGGCSRLFEVQDQFRIRNLSGKDVTVTSGHTLDDTKIPRGKAALVPHSLGDIVIQQRDAKTWLYKNVSRSALGGTPYCVKSHYYIPFGGGSLTVNLVLAEDGRLYAVLPDVNVKTEDLGKLEQPKGFPLQPAK